MLLLGLLARRDDDEGTSQALQGSMTEAPKRTHSVRKVAPESLIVLMKCGDVNRLSSFNSESHPLVLPWWSDDGTSKEKLMMGRRKKGDDRVCDLLCSCRLTDDRKITSCGFLALCVKDF